MSGFTIANGQILDPSGSPFRVNGVGVFDSQVQSGGASLAQTMLSDFPGMNSVRIASYSFSSPSSYSAFVNYMTAHNVLCIFEDHNTNNAVLSGSALQTEDAWLSSLASYYGSNPYVGFATMNEPGSGDSAQQLSNYNTIRATGNNNIIFMEAGAGADGNPSDLTPSDYTGMHNIAIDMHYYGWMSNFNTSQSAVTAQYNSQIAAMQAAIHSADGTVPVASLEYGNSTNGTSIDPNAAEVVTAVNTDPNSSGGDAWIFDNWGSSSSADNLTVSGSTGGPLSSYGQQVAADIKANASVGVTGGGGSTGSGSGSGSSSGGSGSSSSGSSPIVISPGSGSFTLNGDTYTIDANENAMVNGSPIPGGGGTSHMELYNGAVYGEDASTSNWYTWNGSDWQAATTPPSGSSSGSGSTETIITPGNGSFTDAAGNTYAVSKSGIAMENGSPLPGGGGTAQMEFFNNTVYGQDAASGAWYTWNQITWNPSTAPPTSTGSESNTINLVTQGNVTENVSAAVISATSGSHHLFLTGSNDVVSLLGGSDQLTDNGSTNSIILPAAGNGTLTMTSQILGNGDVFDLRQALAGTAWNGDMTTLSKFLHVNDTPTGNTNIGIDKTGTTGAGTTTLIASIHGATINEATFLTHAIT